MSIHRSLLIAADGTIEQAGETLFELNLGSTAPEVIVAELTLLIAGLAHSIVFRHRSTKLRIRVSRGDIVGRAAAEIDDSQLTLQLSMTELDFWLSYFLRYYRDGVAEVNHIDLEAKSSTITDGIVDIRLSVARSATPVSPDEVRRRIGG